MNPKWLLMGQEKSTQNTAKAKKHFYTFKNHRKLPNYTHKNKATVQNVDGNQRLPWCFAKKPCVSIYAIFFKLYHWGIMRMLQAHVKNTCIVINQTRNLLSSSPYESVRFLWDTAVLLAAIWPRRGEHRAGKTGWWNPDLTVQMIICHSCSWLRSYIIRNKLTWKHIQFVSMSAPPHPPKLLRPQPDPRLQQLLPSSQPPPPMQQPLCPLLSGHLAWQSIILTAPRERMRETKRQRDYGYFDFQTWAPIFFYLLLSSSFLCAFVSFQLSLLPFFNLLPL